MANEELERYVESQVEKIDITSGTELNNYLIDLFETIASNDEIIIKKDNNDEELDNIIDISDKYLKLDLLLRIFDDIKKDDDKKLFIEGVINKDDIFDYNIIKEFVNIKNNSNLFEEELEEEQEELEEIEEFEENIPSDNNENTEYEEEQEEKNEEELEETEIVKYERKTERLKEELERLERELKEPNKGNEEEINSLEQMIIETEKKKEELLQEEPINENEIENLNNLIESYKNKLEELKNEKIENIPEDELGEIINNVAFENIDLSNLIAEKEAYIKEQRENLKLFERIKENYENDNTIKEERISRLHDQRIEEQKELIRRAELELENIKRKQNEVSGPEFKVQVVNFLDLYEQETKKLEEDLNKVTELLQDDYVNGRGYNIELYGMKKRLSEQIANMRNLKNDCIKREVRSQMNLNNLENKPLVQSVIEARNLDNEIKDKLNLNKSEEQTIEQQELIERINDLKSEISNREENIERYYDALNDIEKLENDIKENKITKEEQQEKIENIKNKINLLPKELKDELNEILNNVLGLDKKPPVKPRKKVKKVLKNIADWFKKHKNKLLLTGIGLALTTLLVYQIPQVQMMINSALWNAGKASGSLSAAELENLHNLNVGLSKTVANGKYAFDSASGLYTLGGKAGAEALYNSGQAGLVNSLMNFGKLASTGLIMGGLIPNIIEKIKNYKNKATDKKEEELEEIEEIETPENKSDKKDLLEEIKEEMAKITSQNQQLIEQNNELMAQMKEKDLENAELRKQLEELMQEKEAERTL